MNEQKKIRRHVFIEGLVQGVGFRRSLLNEVEKYPRIFGFVRNLADGRVEALFEGEESSVLSLCHWCSEGPRLAQVSRILVQEEDPQGGLSEFNLIA